MGKYKDFLKNIGLISISNFGTKILTFLLVPLYTSALTTSEYGIYDFFVTTISLLGPILTLNIAEAVIIFALNNKYDIYDVYSSGFWCFLIGSIILLIIIYINNISGLSLYIKQYWLLFYLLFLFTWYLELVNAFARGIERVKEYAVAGVLGTVIIVILNILFLLYLKAGLVGYFLANIIGVACQSFYLTIKLKTYKYIRLLHVGNKIFREMIAYSLPLIANAISWWVNNASDRYVVIAISGMAANGIYSVSYKIPSILNAVQSIFNQAWSISAVKNLNEDKNEHFFSNIYNIYCCIMCVCCSLLIILDKPIAKFLYANNFYSAWKYVPFLLISVVFGSLSGYAGGIFSSVHNSKTLAITTSIGAVVNLVFNFAFVYLIGPLGAAISTMISFYLVWLIRIKLLNKYIMLTRHKFKEYIAYGTLLVQAIFLLVINESVISLFVQLLLFVVILATFWSEIKLILSRICKFHA